MLRLSQRITLAHICMPKLMLQDIPFIPPAPFRLTRRVPLVRKGGASSVELKSRVKVEGRVSVKVKSRVKVEGRVS